MGPGCKASGNLEDAFWPVRHLAELIRTRQVTSLETTEMYLAPHRYNGVLNVVLDDHGRAGAKRADTEIAAGSRVRCMAFRGGRKTSSRSKVIRPPGDRRRSRIRSLTTTRA